jgi:hypothetical protein
MEFAHQHGTVKSTHISRAEQLLAVRRSTPTQAQQLEPMQALSRAQPLLATNPYPSTASPDKPKPMKNLLGVPRRVMGEDGWPRRPPTATSGVLIQPGRIVGPAQGRPHDEPAADAPLEEHRKPAISRRSDMPDMLHVDSGLVDGQLVTDLGKLDSRIPQYWWQTLCANAEATRPSGRPQPVSTHETTGARARLDRSELAQLAVQVRALLAEMDGQPSADVGRRTISVDPQTSEGDSNGKFDAAMLSLIKNVTHALGEAEPLGLAEAEAHLEAEAEAQIVMRRGKDVAIDAVASQKPVAVPAAMVLSETKPALANASVGQQRDLACSPLWPSDGAQFCRVERRKPRGTFALSVDTSEGEGGAHEQLMVARLKSNT